MSEPLKYKAEKAISGFINALSSSALSGYAFYEGQNPGASVPPCVVVYVTAQKESFANSLPKDVSLSVEIVTPIDTDQDADSVSGETTDRATNWTAHRAAVAAVEARLQDLPALKAYANAESDGTRPCKDFFIYDIQEDGQSSMMAGEARHMISAIQLTLVCEAQNN
jgi:hypothetical protein